MKAGGIDNTEEMETWQEQMQNLIQLGKKVRRITKL